MGYGTRERIEVEQELFEWLQDTAGLPGGMAHGIANSLSNRAQLTIKRKALLNVLKAPDKGVQAPELFEVMLDRKIIALERGDLRHPGQNEHLDEISREVPLFARWMFLQTIREGKRIPQEVIPLEVLLE